MNKFQLNNKVPLRNNNNVTSKDGGVVVGQSCKSHDHLTEGTTGISCVDARHNIEASTNDQRLSSEDKSHRVQSR